jgi:GNAT superfamily N-acetyltransferase
MQDGRASSDLTIGPNLQFRLAGIDDYSTIRHVHASAIRALNERLIDANDVTQAVSTIYSSTYVTDLIAKATQVALLNGDIVGTCAWSASDDRGHAARIGSLFVLPLFQGRGIARQLIQHTEQEAARHGYTRFAAIVPAALAALYEHLDYVTTSFGTSRDVVPGVAVQVAFVRKPR